MQKGYGNVKGWLEIIMDDKIYIDFSEFEYEECSRRLKHELDVHFNMKAPVLSAIGEIQIPALASNNVLSQKDDKTILKCEHLIENWTDKDVEEWFLKNNLNISIYGHFKPFYGSVLKRVNHFQMEAPQIFYQSMKEIVNLRSTDIIIFSAHLDKLFKSSK